MATTEEIREKGSNLSIPLYVRTASKQQLTLSEEPGTYGQDSLKQAIAKWQESSMALRESMNGLLTMFENEQQE